jgi:hypothetical protein
MANDGSPQQVESGSRVFPHVDPQNQRQVAVEGDGGRDSEQMSTPTKTHDGCVISTSDERAEELRGRGAAGDPETFGRFWLTRCPPSLRVPRGQKELDI